MPAGPEAGPRSPALPGRQDEMQHSGSLQCAGPYSAARATALFAEPRLLPPSTSTICSLFSLCLLPNPIVPTFQSHFLRSSHFNRPAPARPPRPPASAAANSRQPATPSPSPPPSFALSLSVTATHYPNYCSRKLLEPADPADTTIYPIVSTGRVVLPKTFRSSQELLIPPVRVSVYFSHAKRDFLPRTTKMIKELQKWQRYFATRSQFTKFNLSLQYLFSQG